MPELAVLMLLLLATAGGCPACQQERAQLRQLSLSNIKEHILTRLGFEQPPNITGRSIPNIPPLEDLYDRFQADQPHLVEDEEPELAPEKVYAFAQQHPKMRHTRGKELFHFKFSEKVLENKVIKAFLWLYTKGGQKEESTPAHITVYKVGTTEPPAFTPIKDQRVARSTRGHWEALDVKSLVSEWFKSPLEPMKLAIQGTTTENGHEVVATQRLVVTSTRTEESSYVPFLELHVTSLKKLRPKRTVGLNCPENSEEKRCCRYPLTVDFESFGWDWVIAPKKYEAHYCSGDCPFVFLPRYPHTHIVHLASPSGSAGPCCAPRKMSSISMLYFDNDLNIIFGLLPGMVVERCGCS